MLHSDLAGRHSDVLPARAIGQEKQAEFRVLTCRLHVGLHVGRVMPQLATIGMPGCHTAGCLHRSRGAEVFGGNRTSPQPIARLVPRVGFRQPGARLDQAAATTSKRFGGGGGWRPGALAFLAPYRTRAHPTRWWALLPFWGL